MREDKNSRGFFLSSATTMLKQRQMDHDWSVKNDTLFRKHHNGGAQCGDD